MSVHLKDHFINLPQLLLYLLYCVSFSLCYQNASVSIWHRVSPKKLNRQSLAQRKVYCRDTRGEWVALPLNPELLEGFSKTFLKAKWGKDVVGCCKLLGVESSVFAAVHVGSGHDVPVNLQDTCYSLFCNFFIPVWIDKCYTYIDKSLEDGLSCVFHAIGNILNSKQRQ